jgi:Enoyl-CoA hydratase/isomerase
MSRSCAFDSPRRSHNAIAQRNSMNIGTFPLAIDSGIAVLTLDRPFCLDIAGKHALSETMTSLRGRSEVRALIIASGNQQGFLVNVAELAEMSAEAAAAFSASGHAVAAAIETLPFPVIAAVEGPALGGGCELVLACDLAVAGGQATFGQIEGLRWSNACLRRMLALGPSRGSPTRSGNDVHCDCDQCPNRKNVWPRA